MFNDELPPEELQAALEDLDQQEACCVNQIWDLNLTIQEIQKERQSLLIRNPSCIHQSEDDHE